MEWNDYKAICESPEYFSRWALEKTAEILGDGVVQRLLERITATSPVEKPQDHKGGPATDYFRVEIDEEIVKVVICTLQGHAAGLDEKSRGRIQHLAIVWQEYLSSKAD